MRSLPPSRERTSALVLLTQVALALALRLGLAAQGLEGLVAKRANSRYEPGQRSGAWMKMRVNRSQELTIGGYSVGGSTFDAVIVGHVVDGKLVYVARTRSGFTPPGAPLPRVPWRFCAANRQGPNAFR